MTADARVRLTPVAPEGLSRRARRFVEVHGLRVPCPDVRPHRDVWLRHGIPAEAADPAAAFHLR